MVQIISPSCTTSFATARVTLTFLRRFHFGWRFGGCFFKSLFKNFPDDPADDFDFFECEGGWYRGERDPSKCYRASTLKILHANETQTVCRYMRGPTDPIPAEPRTTDQAVDVRAFVTASKNYFPSRIPYIFKNYEWIARAFSIK